MAVKVITPYVYDNEIAEHKDKFWDLDIYYEKDVAGIGSDLMYQKMWNQFPEHDIFILHADMHPFKDGWWEEMLEYVDKYPEAGMLGLLLLYPAQNDNYEHYIQCAGGQFTDGKPDHFGSGLILENKSQFKQDLEVDDGRYTAVREVAWTTFGGCYLRRSFLDTVGDFSPEYEWTYNRDVDYCLKAREAGEHIYQIPVRLLHHESRDNKRIKDQSKADMESRNLQTLLEKWANSKFYKTLDKEIQSG